MGERVKQRGTLREKLTAGRLDLILRELDGLPMLPAVAASLRKLIVASKAGQSDPGSTEEHFLLLIGSDPALTAKLLSMANRIRPGGARTAVQAAQLLGFEVVRSAALAARTAGRPERNDEWDEISFWRHCLAVALAAESITEALKLPVEPAEVFTCGLLHDLGKLVLRHCMPKTYRRALQAAKMHHGDFADYERQVIGLDHAVAGRRLAELWRLPETIQQVIWLHHQPIEAIPPSLADRPLISVIGLADMIARQQRLGLSTDGGSGQSVKQLAGQIGLDAKALTKIAENLPARLEQHCRRLGLEQIDNGSPDADALADANAELGRLNEQLCLRAEILAGHAQALQHLIDFTTALTPEATVSEVLLRIANTVAAACGVQPSAASPVVAYSIDRENNKLLAICQHGDAESLWRTFPVSAQFDPSRSAQAGPAAEAIASVLAHPEDLADWLEPASCMHQPLICNKRWIGGAIYPRPEHSNAERVIESLAAGAVAMTLGFAQGRSRAVQLSEQLAGATEVLAKTQKALTEAKAISAVGEMAAGAAHELNNPLALISGRAQLMREKASTDQDRKTWQQIADQAQQVSDIVSELMSFAHPPEPKAAALNVRELLKRVAEEFSVSSHPKAAAVRVDIKVGKRLPSVLVDAAQIQAVLLELMNNAATAATSEPQICLSARSDEVGRTVLLSVQDGGPGMDSHTRDNAFTPFFSAQEAGRRRGLGLSKAKRTVETNGGRIWIDSRTDEGTTVHIQLPAAKAEPTNPEDANAH
ncbi:MAG: HDOD domain-containing protein [Planctomycetota bacterium]|nr:HDOD domain-containing protein [Planctomycetota bacterium]